MTPRMCACVYLSIRLSELYSRMTISVYTCPRFPPLARAPPVMYRWYPFLLLIGGKDWPGCGKGTASPTITHFSVSTCFVAEPASVRVRDNIEHRRYDERYNSWAGMNEGRYTSPLTSAHRQGTLQLGTTTSDGQRDTSATQQDISYARADLIVRTGRAAVRLPAGPTRSPPGQSLAVRATYGRQRRRRASQKRRSILDDCFACRNQHTQRRRPGSLWWRVTGKRTNGQE